MTGSGGGRLILALETSNPSASADACGVAVGAIDGEGRVGVLGAERLRPTGRHDDDLMPAIDRLFRRIGAGPAEVGRIAVSVGPGGYTALRIAVATAKAIAMATGAACVPVPTLEVVARRAVATDSPPGRFAVGLASKGESAFVGVFEPGADGELRAVAGGDGRLMTAVDAATLAALGVRRLVIDGFAPGKLVERVRELGIAVEPPRFDPVACLEASLARPGVSPAELLPLYPREPDAVTLWRARKSGG